MVLQTSAGKWTLAVALAGVAAAAVGYAVYFDHKRRHDASFRRQLRTGSPWANFVEKRKEKADELLAESTKEEPLPKAEEIEEVEVVRGLPTGHGGPPDAIPKEMLDFLPKCDDSLEKLRELSLEDQQKVFYSLLVKGETLMVQGEAGARRAVDYFVKAMQIVPAPIEVLAAFKQTLDPQMYRQVERRFQAENLKKAQNYLDQIVVGQDWFRFESRGDETELHWYPAAIQKIEEGREIFGELPDVAWHADGDRCEQCHGRIAAEPCACDRCGHAVFCSEKCRQAGFASFHIFTCTEPKAFEAFQKLQAHCKSANAVAPLLMLRYLSILLTEEMKGNGSESGGPFLHYDHLRPVLKNASAAERREAAMIRDVFAVCDKNMVEFLKDDVYAAMKATVMYNAIGFKTGDAVTADSPTRKDKHEPVRVSGSASSSDIVGLYHTLAHIPHACDPNCEIVAASPDGAPRLVLRATRCIAKGETLGVAFAPCQAMPVDKRRSLLKKDFFIPDCMCTACKNESKAAK